ncbi:MAG: YggS family pyridoxal phosphate-dependent enzyme [Crocinitomicaceae bacterium]|jgi:pyridoxal phosphate enzyme (YggS family)
MIKNQLFNVRKDIPDSVTLVAVSKTKPISVLKEVYDLGERIFGENKVRELVEKHEALPKDIKWHLIGHLQSNKVKYIAPFVAMIHSIDSLKLLKEINKQALKNNRVIDCLLQFHIAEEDSKFGLTLLSAKELLESSEFSEMRNISIVGLMGMATFTKNEEQVREEFRTLENYFHVIQSHFFKFNPSFEHISMGMSGDYKMAIEEGSTMVRIGSYIFGTR